VLKNRVGESWCQNHLADQQVYQLLEKVDGDLTEEARQQGCLLCGGKLHRSDYDRKPRGSPQWEMRFSLCCAKEGCRRRHTPPSVRFMGQRVYAGLVVVLVSAMIRGLKLERVELLREAVGIDRRTLERWHQWWLGPLRGKFVLEGSSRPVYAAVVPKDDALVLVRELWGRTARPAFGIAQVSGSDHHPDCLERVRYVRLVPSPAEDAGRPDDLPSSRITEDYPMITNTCSPAWFQQALDTADDLRDTIGVLLVANLKGRTTPIDDYETDSIATEFLSAKELDDFIKGFEQAGIYCEVVVDEGGFLKWLNEGHFQFGRAHPIVYNVTQNGTGPARFSLVPGLCRLHRLPLVDSDAYTAALGQHKFHFISLLEHFGLPVARSWWFTKHDWWPARPPAGLRVIAKPTLDSASVGIHRDSVSCVDGSLETRLGVLADSFRQAITVQEFIPGFEVEVPVLEAQEPRACMAVGIQLQGRRNLGDSFLVYDDVFADGYEFYDFSEEDRKNAIRIMEFARQAHVGLGFIGPSRIDFRVSATGDARIMEVTCKPHLTVHTSFAYSMAAMGHSYADLLKFLVGSAAQRLGMRPM